MESTKTFVEHPSGKLAVTVHAPRSLREEEAAYFHGINLEQAHKFAHLNGWQLTVDREKDDTVSAADADSFKIGDATIDGVGGKGQQAVRIEAKVGVSDGAEKTDVPIPTEKDIKPVPMGGMTMRFLIVSFPILPFSKSFSYFIHT